MYNHVYRLQRLCDRLVARTHANMQPRLCRRLVARLLCDRKLKEIMLTLMKILHPGLVIESLQRIDAEFPSWTMDRPQALRRTLVALGASCTCLLLLNYLQPIVVWHFLLSTAAKILDMPSHTYLTYLKANGWLTFSEYLWWGFCHFLTLLLLPCFLIRRCFKAKLGDYGMHWNDVSIHFIWYAALLALIVFFVICVSFGRDFIDWLAEAGLISLSGNRYTSVSLFFLNSFSEDSC
jgi:hypothetical protein